MLEETSQAYSIPVLMYVRCRTLMTRASLRSDRPFAPSKPNASRPTSPTPSGGILLRDLDHSRMFMIFAKLEER